MKATILWAGALLATALAASLASADPYCSPVFHVPLPPAPDACGPGFYTVGPCGMVYGPNYWLRPPWEPFNGYYSPPYKGAPMAAGPGLPGPLPVKFPTHPYVRGPRDFFMSRENMEDQMRRDQRPALVP